MNKKRLIAKIIMTVLCVVAVGFIFWNSSLDAESSTSQSSPLVDGINQFFESIHLNITVTDKMIRKTAHFSEYALLGALLSVTLYLYVRNRRETFVMALPLGCAVAVFDETIQLFPKGRSCEIKDILIDCAGVLCAALIIQLILYMKERHKRKKEGKESERFIAE